MAIRRAPARLGPGQAIRLAVQLPRWVRLHWRLVRDRRVGLWPKALLAVAVLYVLLPFDLIPDTLPFVGEVDDVVVLMVAARWFLGFCPTAVVAEHGRALGIRPA
jgi:uncharacterized membrane protein YkvA (DUF1232 family)